MMDIINPIELNKVGANNIAIKVQNLRKCYHITISRVTT